MGTPWGSVPVWAAAAWSEAEEKFSTKAASDFKLIRFQKPFFLKTKQKNSSCRKPEVFVCLSL